MNQLRIGVDIRPLLHPFSGIGRYTHVLLKKIVNSNHQWFFYCDRYYDGSFDDHINITIRSSNRRGPSIFNLWTSQILFSRWANLDQLDVFWSPRHHLPLFLSNKIKTLITIHDLVWRRVPETMSKKNRIIEMLLMPPSLKRADKLIAVSNYTADEIFDLYPQYAEKTLVVQEAAFEKEDLKENNDELELMELSLLPKKYFLFVGTNEPRKNINYLLFSYSQLIKFDPSIGLVLVVGEGWGNEKIEDQLQEFGLSDKVLHFNNLHDSQMDQLYKRAHALVLPSYYEGFGLPVLESISRGVPVIVSNKGSLPEIVSDAGLVVCIEDKGALIEGMKCLCVDDNLHKQLASNCLLRANDFSWEKATAETLEIIQSISTTQV
mgnify:CR=1 FL=1|tara:strand:- start:221 stop:1354 length:1134 start_codon:yes stop_codon:yes gene_type:complete